MLSIVYLGLFLMAGVWIIRCLLPRLTPLVRGYIGVSLGVLLLMWLPALWAYAVAFTLFAHWLSLATLGGLCLIAFWQRDKRPLRRFDDKQRKQLTRLCIMVIPLMILSAYLQYTHCIRLADDGTYHVGQSTYGDLSLHLAVTTSIENAQFPLHNSLMIDETMAYPYLSDSIATSMLMLGQSLPMAMSFTGTLMMTLVYTGYALLCMQLCKRVAAQYLAFYLLFFNGGLGFLWTLSTNVTGVTNSLWTNLETTMTGFYQTPTNQPDPYNLRWVNIICDMLLPQRGILGGWTMLMPCLNLLLPPFAHRKKPNARTMIILGVFAGALPLIHTHSYLALGLLSIGMCAYTVFTAPKEERFAVFRPWLIYGVIAAALSFPQLFLFTFVQATNSSHFLRFQFNWCNNRNNQGLVDNYFWFYIKNIGFPYLLILLSLMERKPKNDLTLSQPLYQKRMLACGAFLIYAVAEFIIFQPNEYDNNKLFYVWFLLCLPAAADYAMDLFDRLRGIAGRKVIAMLCLICLFLSAGLTVARECVSDYYAYSAIDIQTAEWVKENTPEHSIFLTGNQHLNPISSLAGRTILCSSDSYLYYHGFDTTSRRIQIAAFFADPVSQASFLEEYDVDYIYISPYERNSDWFDVDEAQIESLYPLVYESSGGINRIFAVKETGT